MPESSNPKFPMIFSIFIILVIAAVAFFHYIQGFFSATISAIIAIISAVIALSYFETLTEGLLSGIMPDWMPALILLGLFAVVYVTLRTISDKLIPGGVQLPAAVDKVGGAAMGLVAGGFAAGIIAIAAQQLPLAPSLGGYSRYETVDFRSAPIPSSSPGSSPKEGGTYDEMTADTFEEDKLKKMFVPVDDFVVATVAHLSAGGSLNTDKPLTSVHPNLLQELFGQRLGIEKESDRTAVNQPAKGKNAVEVAGVFRAPPFGEAQTTDHEFKRTRGGTAVKPPKLGSDEMRVIVRIRFNTSAANLKDKKVRVSPGAIRLVAQRPNDEGTLVPHNYYPIGTLEPNGVFYANKIDDPLIIDVPAKKLDGAGDGPAEVDFVFQVKKEGFVDKDEKAIAPGTFLEVKKQARVDLSSGDAATIKPAWRPAEVLALKRKNLQWEGGLKALEPGKGGAAVLAAPPPTTGGGGGELGQRLAGQWETRSGIRVSETLNITADGKITSQDGNGTTTEYRWAASGQPQGDVLTMQVSQVADATKTEKWTITFTGDAEFNLADSTGGNRRFTRVGAAPAAEGTAAPAPNAAPNETMSKMIGKWDSELLSYTFHSDGTYAAAQVASETTEARSATGTWSIKSVEGPAVTIELIPPSKTPTSQKWELGAEGSNEMTRISSDGKRTVFKRTS